MVMRISCQNGCDNDKPQFDRKAVVLIKEIKTGEVKAFCWKCISTKLCEFSNNDAITLKEEFENWISLA